jgi:hypothetical protein
VSAQSLRAGIKTFVDSAAIAGLQPLFLEYPWRTAGQAFALDPVRGWAAIAWPHLDQQSEHRLTFPAGTGSKEIVYRVGLLTVFQYRIPATLPDGAREDDWSKAHDGLLDALCARLRSDQTLGGTVLQAGEGDQPQLTIKRDLPQLNGGVLWAWTAIEFDAAEIIQA